MAEVYYVIYTTTIAYGQECPSYLQLVNEGHLLQSGLYDASKYTDKEKAEAELAITSGKFKDKKFDIIPVDRRIFGSYPRFVER